jgi:threonine dehydrogenase-like Zn-dependent dehydrogenase
LLIVIGFIAFEACSIEKKDHVVIHGAGQIGLLTAVALFGMDYFISVFYGTGGSMSASNLMV